MQCIHPNNYDKYGEYITVYPPCNKCLPCRLNKQHTWAARLVLESMDHSQAQFITCTFDNEHLPQSQDSKDYKRIWQLFIKRVNKATGIQPRYFACFEYGTRFGRPHYHAIFFGRSTKLERRKATRSETKNTVVYVDPVIEDCWGLGSTYVKACDSTSMKASITNYVAAYLLKNVWNQNESDKPSSKSEWALMSRKPYIGCGAVKRFSELYTTAKGCRLIAKLGTIPDSFHFNKRRYQMPTRIRWEIGAYLGYPVTPLPQNVKETYTIAKARASKIQNTIKRRRKLNTSLQTG